MGIPLNIGFWICQAMANFWARPRVCFTDLIWRVIELHGVIPARGFFLLERGSDDVVRNVRANLIYPETMRVGQKEIPILFSVEGDVIELLDPRGEVVDTANADPRVIGWSAGTLVPPSSMERKAPHLPDTQENWWTNIGAITYGVDAKGIVINGTVWNVNEPEILLGSLTPLTTKRGQKIELTRYAAVRPETAIQVRILRQDVAGGVGMASIDREDVDIRWDSFFRMVSIAVDTKALEPGSYWLVIRVEEGNFLVVPLVIR